MAVKRVLITSGTTYTIPSDYQSLVSVEAIGAGGGSNATFVGGGGAGGGYGKSTAISLVAGQLCYVSIGAGSASADGGDSWFSTINGTPGSASGGVRGSGGRVGTTSIGGVAGTTNLGNTTFSGGAGGALGTTGSAGGGGGAAGPNGAGRAGGNGGGTSTGTGGGGGGSNGGVAGTTPTTTSGGAGGNGLGNGSTITGGGAGANTTTGAAVAGTVGTGGGGGGRASSTNTIGAAGGSGSLWAITAGGTAGPGGGGGGGSGAGALYGGGKGGGTIANSSAQGCVIFTYNSYDVPTVTGISPNTGGTGGGTSVTITGTGFTGSTATTIGGSAVTSRVVVNDTTITCNTPSGTAGLKAVAVTNPAGTGSASLFTYVAAPTVSSCSPNTGPTSGGTFVTITGNNFNGATNVTCGGTAVTGISVVNNTTITCTTPAGTAGLKAVAVNTPYGTGVANVFTYVAPPTVSACSPNTGPTSGGTSVTISGSNFTGVTSVTFGGVAATSVSVTNSTTLTCVTPAGTAGLTSVAVTGTGGTGSGNVFTYVAAPTVTGCSPSTGPTAGGTSVTVTGTNFTGVSSVTFDGVAATSVSVTNSTTLTCVTPSNTEGPATVAVTATGGTGSGTVYTYIAAPTVTDCSPNNGPIAGGTTVTITGTNFIGVTSVKFDGVSATGVSISDSTTLTCITPAGTDGPATVSVTGTGGTGSADMFTYIAASGNFFLMFS